MSQPTGRRRGRWSTSAAGPSPRPDVAEVALEQRLRESAEVATKAGLGGHRRLEASRRWASQLSPPSAGGVSGDKRESICRTLFGPGNSRRGDRQDRTGPHRREPIATSRLSINYDTIGG